MYLLFLLHRHYEINTAMVAIFVFGTRVTEQRSGMIINAGKDVKRKGVGSAKYSKTKMDFKTEIRGLTYIYKTKSSVIFLKHYQYQDQVYHIHEIFSLHCCVR